MPTTQPEVNLGDIVRVVNRGDNSLILSWDSKRNVVPGHGESFLSFEAAKLYFGDPRSGERIVSIRNDQGLVQWVPDRATEVRRLRTLYGEPAGDESVFTRGPNVEVYTLDGERIIMVLDDPVGDTAIEVKSTVADNATLWSTIQRQQQQLDVLMKRLSIKPGDPTLVDQYTADRGVDVISDAVDALQPETEGDSVGDGPGGPPIYDDLPPEDA